MDNNTRRKMVHHMISHIRAGDSFATMSSDFSTVTFNDSRGAILVSDLGYNSRCGYYSISLYPSKKNQFSKILANTSVPAHFTY